MALASTIGRDRPDDGAPVDVVVLGTSYRSQVRRSGEVAICTAVPRTRDGRRVRLPLGTDVAVTWSDLGQVRSRSYTLAEVAGGGDPQWRLVPAATAGEGNRRLSARAAVDMPVGVEGPDGIVIGSGVDLSTTGARIAFPPPPPGTPVRALPPAGADGEVVLVLDGTRLQLPVHVVHRSGDAGGRRELRVAFADLDARSRAVLDEAVRGLLPDAAPQGAEQSDR